MTQLKAYKLKSGKTVWATAEDALKGTIWETKIVGGLGETKSK